MMSEDLDTTRLVSYQVDQLASQFLWPDNKQYTVEDLSFYTSTDVNETMVITPPQQKEEGQLDITEISEETLEFSTPEQTKSQFLKLKTSCHKTPAQFPNELLDRTFDLDVSYLSVDASFLENPENTINGSDFDFRDDDARDKRMKT